MAHFIYHNREHRRAKARTVAAILASETDLAQAHLLETGTGAGYLSAYFGEVARSVVSVDVVDEREESTGYEFRQVDGVGLPFADESFDVVVSNQVIEHLSEQERHVAECFRVLKPGGFAYIATPNRFWPREVHSGLWLLGWWPRPLASQIYRWARQAEWDVYPLSIGRLRRLLRPFAATISDYAPRVLKEPDRFAYSGNLRPLKWVRWLPLSALALLTPIMPSFFILCRKPFGEGEAA